MTPFEVVKWPFLGLGDLELVVEKATLKNQDSFFFWDIHGIIIYNNDI